MGLSVLTKTAIDLSQPLGLPGAQQGELWIECDPSHGLLLQLVAMLQIIE